MVAEDGYFLMVDVSIGLLEGCCCCGVCVVDGSDGVCVMRVKVLAGLGGRCEMGSLNGLYSGGDALEC